MGTSEKVSSSNLTETKSSKKQLEILQQREALYQEFSLPRLQGFYEDSSDVVQGGFNALDFAQNGISEINDQFDFQEDQLSKGLALRGLEGSGLEARSLADLGASRASAVSGQLSQGRLASLKANNQAESTNLGIQQNSLNMLLSQAPRPTMASPRGTKTTTKGKSGLGGAIGGALGGVVGTLIAPGVGTGIGSSLGSALGGAAE